MNDLTNLGIAELVASEAKCTRRQVGAIICDSAGRIISSGYNGVPPGFQHCTDGGCPRGLLSKEECAPLSSYNDNPCHAVHAEVNAIMRADPLRREGGTLYVTCEPCQQCWNQIYTSGLRCVVTPEDEHYL